MTGYSATRGLQFGICSAWIRAEPHIRGLAASTLLASALVLAGLAASVEAEDMGSTGGKVSELVLSVSVRPSHNGLYRAEVVQSTPDSRGEPASWVVRVTHDDGTPASDAEIRAGMWMPDTGVYSVSQPITSAHLGDGMYRIEGLHFSQAGWWNVPLRITSGAGVDSLAFNVVIPQETSDDASARSTGGPS